MNFFEQIEVNLITDAGAYTNLEISLMEIWVLMFVPSVLQVERTLQAPHVLRFTLCHNPERSAQNC